MISLRRPSREDYQVAVLRGDNLDLQSECERLKRELTEARHEIEILRGVLRLAQRPAPGG